MTREYYEDKDTMPDIAEISIDPNAPLGKIGEILADLDNEVSGYPYEICDENGDNPEEYFSEPTIEGYIFDYESMRYPELRVFFQRDIRTLRDRWIWLINEFRARDIKIMIVCANRQLTELTDKFNPSWMLKRGKSPPLSWGFDNLRSARGLDLSKWEDARIAYKWVNYVMTNYSAPPENIDYYEFTGSLGHD